MVKSVDIDIDGTRNECLDFRPLPGRTVRGRFDLNRVAEPLAKLRTAELPEPVPGQRIGIDAEGVGYVAEPLYDVEHAAVRERIERRGLRLPPQRESFDGIDVVSWLYWLQRAAESGLARVVSGKLPEKIDGEPRKNFITAEPEKGPLDKLTAAIEAQTAMFARLLERLGAQ